MSGEQHEYDESGHDLWGYDRRGHYDPTWDRAHFQASPFPTCPDCDNGEACVERDAA